MFSNYYYAPIIAKRKEEYSLIFTQCCTSAKNVILFDEKKGGNEIDFFDYSNIKGRSGRMMEHYVGRIFNFCHVPVQESVVIDIPFYEQDPEILTDEILINIKKDDVRKAVRERYDL